MAKKEFLPCSDVPLWTAWAHLDDAAATWNYVEARPSRGPQTAREQGREERGKEGRKEGGEEGRKEGGKERGEEGGKERGKEGGEEGGGEAREGSQEGDQA